jgi:SAM-dependent methyltransferase
VGEKEFGVLANLRTERTVVAARMEHAGDTAVRSSTAYTDLDLHLFGLGLGVRTLPSDPIAGLKSLVLPVEYIRCAETRYILQHLDVRRGHRVLDIGSPKLLSLFLAARLQAEVHATDLLDYFFATYKRYSRVALGRDQGRYHVASEDARNLTYPSAHFDRIFSLSAIEHIPDDGDSSAMQEISRVLAPGGIACVTVPWRDTGYVDEFKHRGDPDAYWVPGDADKVFFQRAYDRDSLERRLVRPSGLTPVDLSFWGERTVPVEHMILNRRVPRIARILLYPAHIVLARLFLRPLAEKEPSRKKVACLTLRKAKA